MGVTRLGWAQFELRSEFGTNQETPLSPASSGEVGFERGNWLHAVALGSNHDGDPRSGLAVYLLRTHNPCPRAGMGKRTQQAGNAGVGANCRQDKELVQKGQEQVS